MNAFEKRVKHHLEKEGWEVLYTGWPDFLAIKRDENGKITERKAVEVKSESDSIRDNQHEMLAALKDVIPIHIAKQEFGYGENHDDRNPFHFLVFNPDMYGEQ